LRLNPERQVSCHTYNDCREKERGRESKSKERTGESTKLPNSDIQKNKTIQMNKNQSIQNLTVTKPNEHKKFRIF
jgi:hypothetical protein